MAIRSGHEACINCRRELSLRRDGKGYKHTYAKDQKYCKNPEGQGPQVGGPLIASSKESPAAFGRRLALENHAAEAHFDGSYHSGGMDDGDVAGVIEARFGFNTPGDRAAHAAYEAETRRLQGSIKPVVLPNIKRRPGPLGLSVVPNLGLVDRISKTRHARSMAYSCPKCTRIFVADLDGPTAPIHKDSITGKTCPPFEPIYYET